jgi:hypothetical protein
MVAVVRVEDLATVFLGDTGGEHGNSATEDEGKIKRCRCSRFQTP